MTDYKKMVWLAHSKYKLLAILMAAGLLWLPSFMYSLGTQHAFFVSAGLIAVLVRCYGLILPLAVVAFIGVVIWQKVKFSRVDWAVALLYGCFWTLFVGLDFYGLLLLFYIFG